MEATMEGVAEATHGELHIHLEYEGEGLNEEYQPDDPDDKPLLRFRLSANGDLAKKLADEGRGDYEPETPENWMDVNGSYCTQIVATISIDDATALAEKMVKAAADEYALGQSSLKRICERLSWVGDADEPAEILREMR